MIIIIINKTLKEMVFLLWIISQSIIRFNSAFLLFFLISVFFQFQFFLLTFSF